MILIHACLRGLDWVLEALNKGFAIEVLEARLASDNPNIPAIQQAATDAMSTAVQQTRKLEAELAKARRLLASLYELMGITHERLERLDTIFEALKKVNK
ncbi:unnamed protein product [Penicillium pancosmium]